jgi:thymidine kinase
LVDEAQFLKKNQVLQLCQVADKLKVPVLTYGLRSDFLGHLFEGSAALLALADKLCEIKTICPCGRKATMNLRMDANGQTITNGNQIEIGGNDQYIALCRRCFSERHEQVTCQV